MAGSMISIILTAHAKRVMVIRVDSVARGQKRGIMSRTVTCLADTNRDSRPPKPDTSSVGFRRRRLLSEDARTGGS